MAQRPISSDAPLGSSFDEVVVPPGSHDRRRPSEEVLGYLRVAHHEPILRPHHCTVHQRPLQHLDTTHCHTFPPSKYIGSPPPPTGTPAPPERTPAARDDDEGRESIHRWVYSEQRSTDELKRAIRYGRMTDQRYDEAQADMREQLAKPPVNYHPSWHNSRSIVKPGHWKADRTQ
ncbi:hypothetical protein AB1Y20_018227 [Prymnesium parvum]|uniref:Uncharacterized protein n=1 Tax=Prymnesium parvum TaxID=97485 RepID=A0AB34JQW3_PRYPA